MSEAVTSVMLPGRGLVRWPTGEERVEYRVTIRLDNTVSRIWIAEPVPEIFRPTRHGNIFLHMHEGRRIAVNVAPNGHFRQMTRFGN